MTPPCRHPLEEVLSGSTYAWSDSESAALEEHLKNNLVYGFIYPSKSPERAFMFFFSYRSMGVSAPAWITEAERHHSEEPAPPASYPGAPWISAVGYLIHRGGSTRRHYEHPVMPFSLCNAPATFQYSVNAVLRDLLHSYATVYLDNNLVFCTSWEVCIEGIQDIFDHMQQCWLCVKLKKCSFHQQGLEFLG